ncbi:Adenosylmethionine-8-amino-7-oxononanoate aminotransferase [Tistlia consotensis]|uniref:Adenosylmethionine-8-amino-7-oxononanoate aminotransferase n=1 Tax=Tistlia consotensis USBA 355 TaxID=560819 RepID=A0A1Y6BPR7_9PROT|nr:aminotransferase [Tistlia consotensis]SMF13707.1 Adenosylmethionine-8-amino-7-oxononanoate aminotransferase [Tistlia consotensis USBA 355]SNR50271.1 Adenosylmethionine-8-amino-7-oxononanoate aminotransferase [Tistlia consotensis]
MAETFADTADRPGRPPEDAAAPLGANAVAELEALATRHLVQPWESLEHLGQEARTLLTGAEGVYVRDARGNRLIDGPAGMWCMQVGYGRRAIAEAMAEQAMSMAYNSPWYSTSPVAAELAARIAEMTPGDLDHVFFTTGGSTAVDSALRFVQFFNNYLGRPEKKIILSRGGAYHGSTYLSASCSGKERDKVYLDFAKDLVVHLSAPNPYRRPEGMSVEGFCDFLIEEMEAKILELGPERVAAFIAEPILASGGVLMPPPGYHRRAQALCRKYDILTISDEVVTAFGRLGHWFASEAVFGITPDIVTFAKGVTSGYVPLGGFAISRAVVEQVAGPENKGSVYSNGYTYSGHPVSCAAALANIRIIEQEGLLEHVREIAPYFQARLRELEALPLVGEVRGLGLMACVDCVADKQSKNPLALDKEVGGRIDAHCQELGLVVRPIYNMCVMSPPLIIEKPEIDRLVEILRQGIERTQDDLEREGLWRR